MALRLVFRGSVSRDTDVVCIVIEQGFNYQASTAEASWIVAARLGLLDGAVGYPRPSKAQTRAHRRNG